MRLSGQIALVTGSRGRLGEIWIDALNGAGALVLGLDIDDLDLTNREAVARMAADFEQLKHIPTILVNNAGVDDRPSPDRLNGPRYDSADAMAQVNLLGTYTMLQEFGSRMRAGSSIINIASLYGLTVPDMRYYGNSGFEKHAMYGATKAGVISLTKYFAALWGPRGVRVNAIAPGGVVDDRDPLTGQDAGFRERYTARIPLGRMCQPSDLGGSLVFLASDASAFMTGQTLVLDGGYTCW